jgi:hypothetical protein
VKHENSGKTENVGRGQADADSQNSRNGVKPTLAKGREKEADSPLDKKEKIDRDRDRHENADCAKRSPHRKAPPIILITAKIIYEKARRRNKNGKKLRLNLHIVYNFLEITIYFSK